ncbi:MAG TPA: hypothetical protein VEV39_04470 [Gemmatimonadales bacterium]|nr:hypothetical protein [Gemmatimonadales bacterium]
MRIAWPALMMAVLLGGCSSERIMMGDTFSVHGVVLAHVNASNSSYCDVQWTTQVNDNGRTYSYSVTFTPSGVGPSTYTGTTTGAAGASMTFPGLSGTVAWAFTWDTLQGGGQATVSSCAVS